MPSRIEYKVDNRLAKLAWLARYAAAADRLAVTHGTAVEYRDTWMVEEFGMAISRGWFHRGSQLFGSGIKIDRNELRFVPSCALVERLRYCRDADTLLVANSLIVLLAAAGARLADDHDYRAEAKAILA